MHGERLSLITLAQARQALEPATTNKQDKNNGHGHTYLGPIQSSFMQAKGAKTKPAVNDSGHKRKGSVETILRARLGHPLSFRVPLSRSLGLARCFGG